MGLVPSDFSEPSFYHCYSFLNSHVPNVFSSSVKELETIVPELLRHLWIWCLLSPRVSAPDTQPRVRRQKPLPDLASSSPSFLASFSHQALQL